MNKDGLIKTVAKNTGYTQKDIAVVVDSVFDTIMNVSKNEEIGISGFGKFGTKIRAGRKGVNPRTGEPIDIASSCIPYFKAGSVFKNLVK